MTKTKYFYKSECDKSDKFLFVVSNGWVNKFVRRNGYLLRCKLTTAQQDPERLINNLILYTFHAQWVSVKYK